MCIDIQGKNILVYGLGKTGLSVVRYLASQEITVTVFDTRLNPPSLEEFRRNHPDIKIVDSRANASFLDSVDIVVLSPGVPRSDAHVVEAISRGIIVIGDIELFANFAKAPIIAISGSNGKSTVTTLVWHMLKQCGKCAYIGGNIGIPALDLLAGDVPDYYVIELSSFQLESTYNLNASVATVLNVTPDHMDRYTSLEDYANTKKKIFNGDGVLIINTDDPYVVSMQEDGRKYFTFSAAVPRENTELGIVENADGTHLAFGDVTLINVQALKISGHHNYLNCLAALGIGFAIDLPMSAMVDALKTFSGLPHRNELILEKDGIRWLNDSKGTNVGASTAAINGVNGRIVLIAGGDGKGADFIPLKEAIARKGAAAILIGRDGEKISKLLQDVVPVFSAKDMIQAVEIAMDIASAGDTVLLSPACASFDMYSSFEERGDTFRKAVLDIAA